MDIQIKEFQTPVITINYETLKAELENKLADYKGLVVTEETLPGSKAAQKELAGLRVKIDTYRKDKKKELETPIKAFEAQCKELIALVESVEQPIKEGIKGFDDLKREVKRQKALILIAEVAEEQGLNEKYTAKLDVLDNYMNLTATEKGVREDLETRAFALKVEQDREQDREQERIDIIQSVINSENERLKSKLELANFSYEINSGRPTSEIIDSIKKIAEQIYLAENSPVVPKEKTEPEKVVPEKSMPVVQKEEPKEPEKQYVVTYEVIGKLEELKGVSQYLKDRGITYKVISQKEA